MKLTSSVGLPALSESHRTDIATMSDILHKFRKRMLFVALTSVSSVVMVSETLVSLIYAQRHHATGQFVDAFTPLGVVLPVFAVYNNVLLALVKSQTD